MGWKEVLAKLVIDAENQYDMMKYRLRERLGGRDPIMIMPYHGFGTRHELILKGRVLENKHIDSAMEDDSLWNNLVNMYKRFESDEIPFARVRARFGEVVQDVEANIEGYFEVHLPLAEPLEGDRMWYTIELELLHPIREGAEPARAEGQVLVPPPGSEFGVISDIDDTVLQTHGTELLKMARTVMLGNARTRLPFPGVAAFYRALLTGPDDEGINPIFYVSSSPWNLYDLLIDFFHLQNIPLGPVLFLRDWGISKKELLPTQHRAYKLKAIEMILNSYSDLPFILIGDSGQEDPEIYAEAVETYPDRILAIYIRNVRRDLGRPEAVKELAKGVTEAGSVLILADDTKPMAEHALSEGWITPESLPAILAEIEKDQAPPSTVEKLLGEEEQPEGPTVVLDAEDKQEAEAAIDEGALEGAMEIGEEQTKEPPTVVIDAEDKEKRPPEADEE